MTDEKFEHLRTKAFRSIEVYGGQDKRAVIASANAIAYAIVDGGFKRAPWVDCPAHVPTGGAFMTLMQSRRSADKLQQYDAREWRYENERVELDNAFRLRTIVETFRELDAISAEGGEDKERAHKLQRVLVDHAQSEYCGALITRAPTEWPALDRWCREQVSKDHPVPSWFRFRTVLGNAPMHDDDNPSGGAWQ